MGHNHLINEKSPYLKQHAHNPVDWYPWSNEVFEKATKENRPIFLSIGYATCHWCHVMERESFEDETIAQFLNETFISIKVDREERPDIDALYMAACQLYTGSGGWPLTVLITPDKKPFFAATYLPKATKVGRIGVKELCQNVKALWDNDPIKILDIASTAYDQLKVLFSPSNGKKVDRSILTTAYDRIEKSFDEINGGFGKAPFFPTPHRINFLLDKDVSQEQVNAVQIAEKTLSAMRLGGIWDHIGFGFHRYATDNQWRVPHFEKMLYDQALLAETYLNAFEVTHKETYAWTTKEIFSYVQRELTDDQGGFYAGEDADTEGEEGKFYLWSQDEFRDVISENDSEFWEKVFNLSEDGNFLDEATRQKNGKNIPYLTETFKDISKTSQIPLEELWIKFEDVRKRLFDKREERPRPFKDTKILTDWNGLMIAALSKGSHILKNDPYKEMAEKATQFILDKLIIDDQLIHRYKDGEAKIHALANDYAFFIHGLLSLHETTHEDQYLDNAIFLKNQMIENCWDEENGLFFLNSLQNDPLIVRPKEFYDGAIPSANSVALTNLATLSRITKDPKYQTYADKLVTAAGGTLSTMPEHFTHFLLGLKEVLV